MDHSVENIAKLGMHMFNFSVIDLCFILATFLNLTRPL